MSKLPFTEVIFGADIQEGYELGQRFALSRLQQFIASEGIETDCCPKSLCYDDIRESNTGVIIGARLLPDDIFTLRKLGLDIK